MSGDSVLPELGAGLSLGRLMLWISSLRTNSEIINPFVTPSSFRASRSWCLMLLVALRKIHQIPPLLHDCWIGSDLFDITVPLYTRTNSVGVYD